MHQKARQIVAARRDNRGRITDFILERENGTKVALSVDEAIRAQEANEYSFFVTRWDEALLVRIERVRGDVVVNSLEGKIDVPSEN